MRKQFYLNLALLNILIFGILVVSVFAQTNDELNVSLEFWQKQKDLAQQPRKAPVGSLPPKTIVPKELMPDGVIKQKAKLKELVEAGYVLPLDFADLAEKHLNGELVELPRATETFLIDVGGRATEDEFSSFRFENGSTKLTSDSAKYLSLQKLASNFSGTKYDLNKAADRKQMRVRLLRMLNPKAKVILEQISQAYYKKFKRPLIITSLTRPIDYQLSLNEIDANSFKVRDKDSLPPHTSGLALDFAYKQMTAIEQNFVMNLLVNLEKRGLIDALRESGENSVFHVFVYDDGKPPIEK